MPGQDNVICSIECMPDFTTSMKPDDVKKLEVGLVTQSQTGPLKVPLYYFGYQRGNVRFINLAVVDRKMLEYLWRQVFIYLETHPEDE
jgi:hypothetical protein